MKKRISIILFLLPFLVFAQEQKDLELVITETLDNPDLEHCQWGGYAAYVESGEVLINHNAEYSLAPASGLKLVTTAAGVSLLGEDYRYKTRLYASAKPDADGVLNGDIYIRGGGDPTLGSDLTEGSLNLEDLSAKWKKALEDAGIKKVNGSVIADDLLFTGAVIPGSWYWNDMGNYYGAQASALSINDNLYHLYFKPGENTGDPTEVLRTEPEIEGLVFENNVTTGPEGSGDNGYIYCAPKQYNAVLRGTIPAGVKEFSIKGSIPDPGIFAAQYFTKYFTENGIPVSGKPYKLKEATDYSDKQLVNEHLSPELKEIILIINKRSFNLYAEQLLKTIGLEKKGEATIEAGVEEVNKFLVNKGVDTGGLMMYDGCGLSRSNTITPELMSEMLKAMYGSEAYAPYYRSMSVAGDPEDIGYFKRWGVGTNMAKNARIKSGGIDRVRSHSGYIKDKNGKMIVFSFIGNNYQGSSRKFNELHEKLLIDLSNLE